MHGAINPPVNNNSSRPIHSGQLNAIAWAVALMVAGTGNAWGVCPADTGGIFRVNTGETCTAANTSYVGGSNANSILRATGAGSIINATAANISVTNAATGNGYGLTTDVGGTINVLGNLDALHSRGFQLNVGVKQPF